MFLGFKPSFWLTLQIIRNSNFVWFESCPSLSWTPGVRFPIGPPSPGRARKIIDHGLHSVVHMVAAGARSRHRPTPAGDGERFIGTAERMVGECLGLGSGPVSDRLYREFRDWLWSEGGVFRPEEQRRYREILVDAAGIISVLPNEPESFSFM